MLSKFVIPRTWKFCIKGTAFAWLILNLMLAAEMILMLSFTMRLYSCLTLDAEYESLPYPSNRMDGSTRCVLGLHFQTALHLSSDHLGLECSPLLSTRGLERAAVYDADMWELKERQERFLRRVHCPEVDLLSFHSNRGSSTGLRQAR